jgi:hypothetical protein
MANEYLVAIHNYISDKIAAAENNKKIAAQQNDLTSLEYWKGQLQELKALRQYLAQQIDLKTQKYF